MELYIVIKRFIFLFCLFGFIHSAMARDADWGISPIPGMQPYSYVGLIFKWKRLSEEALDEVKSLGATRILITKSWSEIEPNKDKNKISDLKDIVVRTESKGFDIMYGLQLINTHKREVPEDLVNVRWNSQEMIDRSIAIVDKTLSLINKNRITYFSFGNEVDVYFENKLDEVDDYKLLADAVIKHVHKNYPNVRMGVTSTFDGLRKNRESIIKRINTNMDVVILTYYGTSDFSTVLPVTAVHDEFKKIVAFSEGKPVLIQELGYTSSEFVGSSEQAQADFFRNAFVAWQNNKDTIKYMSIFLQSDLSTSTCNTLKDYYGFGDYADKFAAQICNLGLKDSSGKPKLAWTVLRDEISPSLNK